MLGRFIALALLLGTVKGHAVAIAGGDGTGNTTAAGAGDGWGYVGSINGASGIYLGSYAGSYWVLTAYHVGPGAYSLGGFSYSYVPASGQQIGDSDLFLMEITSANPLALAHLDSLSNLELAATTPLNEPVTMIGNGRNRATALTTWYVDTDPDPWVWNTAEFPDSDATYSGYLWGSGSTKRWGTNTVEGTDTIVYAIDPFDGPVTNVTVDALFTDFDSVSGEGQAMTGDSGGGIFYYDTVAEEWQLAGLMVTIETLSGQPNNGIVSSAVFGNLTYAADISQYRDEILALVPEPSTASLVVGGLVMLVASRRGRKAAR